MLQRLSLPKIGELNALVRQRCSTQGKHTACIAEEKINQSSALTSRVNQVRLTSDFYHFGSNSNRVLEATDLINQVLGFGILPRINAAVGKGLGLFEIKFSPFSNDLNELTVHIIYNVLQIFFFLLCQLSYGRSRILKFTALEHDSLELRPLKKLTIVHPLSNDTDTAGNRSRVCNNP